MSEMIPPPPLPTATLPPAGWYAEGANQRWWDGTQWTEHRAPGAQPVAPAAPQRQANGMNVSYVRPQTGHSLLLHAFVLGWFCLWINVIYISVSPNHYWHA